MRMIKRYLKKEYLSSKSLEGRQKTIDETRLTQYYINGISKNSRGNW